MKAVVWHGKRDVRVDNVPDPIIKEPTDAIIKVTSTAICGSDLHLYDPLSPLMEEGDILGHEPMGVVQEVGSGVEHIQPGDRVVIPFNISCGSCWMCDHQLFAQCETTQNKEHGTGASLFGYTKLYGHVPGGQAQYLRVPEAHFGPVKVPEGPADERFLFLSDVLPTAWQAVEWAEIAPGGSVCVLGLGPIGQMSARIAAHKGAKVYAVDKVPERLEMARRHGITVIDRSSCDDVTSALLDMTGGRGPDSVIDAVGMEAHGSPGAEIAQKMTGLLPKGISQPLLKKVGIDRLAALMDAVQIVRRGGTISVSGVYGGMTDPMPMLVMFDKGITMRMGQAHVKRWIDQILPLCTDEADPLGLSDFVTHRLPIDDAPRAYSMFQQKQDGAIKIILEP